jgi:hypothetical protein
MKTEDELLDLIAKAYSLGGVEHVKDYFDKNIIYDVQHSEGHPIFGKENVCGELERWFNYNRLFNVTVDTIRYSAKEESIGYVSLEVDFDEVNTCIVIEEDEGLIARMYWVRPNNTGRVRFQKMKKRFFLPRISAGYPKNNQENGYGRLNSIL